MTTFAIGWTCIIVGFLLGSFVTARFANTTVSHDDCDARFAKMCRHYKAEISVLQDEIEKSRS